MKENNLTGIRILVTGCGYTPLKTIFTSITRHEATHDSLVIGDQEFKLNMGAITAEVLALHGATVHMVARTEEKLKTLKNHIAGKTGKPQQIEYSAVDLMDEEKVKELFENLPRDLPIYWFHSVGLSAGSYRPTGNRWLPFQKLTLEHFSTEVIPFWATTTSIAKHLWPIFEKQVESRIVLISSMSAVRGYPLGASHCAATAALDMLANVLTLEGYKKNIFVTTLRAGGIDTGTYENKDIQDSIIAVSDSYGGRWRDEQISLAPPRSIGELVACAFSIPAHVTSMNIVSQGQWPHEGS